MPVIDTQASEPWGGPAASSSLVDQTNAIESEDGNSSRCPDAKIIGESKTDEKTPTIEDLQSVFLGLLARRPLQFIKQHMEQPDTVVPFDIEGGNFPQSEKGKHGILLIHAKLGETSVWENRFKWENLHERKSRVFFPPGHIAGCFSLPLCDLTHGALGAAVYTGQNMDKISLIYIDEQLMTHDTNDIPVAKTTWQSSSFQTYCELRSIFSKVQRFSLTRLKRKSILDVSCQTNHRSDDVKVTPHHILILSDMRLKQIPCFGTTPPMRNLNSSILANSETVSITSLPLLCTNVKFDIIDPLFDKQFDNPVDDIAIKPHRDQPTGDPHRQAFKVSSLRRRIPSGAGCDDVGFTGRCSGKMPVMTHVLFLRGSRRSCGHHFGEKQPGYCPKQKEAVENPNLNR
ncbi:hypothetical protein F2P81_019447 [Scophthalmus maximus]|uniref:Uncharacterized protein n=1 Tax=Scophthalmus maximus TaxID=52904 RepID=A0A6A4S9Q4_SCOMX|nr:hypothetical protein F2P81_019447 [Scophthalmus maximus]